MGIDSSIALQGKLPQFDNPLQQYAQLAQIQQAQQQNKLADLAYSEKQREVGENRLLGEQYKAALGADGTMDRNKLYTGLAGAGLGAKLPGIQKGYADQDKSAMEATKAKLEAGLKHFEVVGQIMSGVRDQASYDIARQQAAQIFGPEAAAKLPAAYDPAVIEQSRQQAMGVKDQLEQQWKALHFGLDKDKFGYQQTNDAANRGVTIRGQDISQGTAIRGQDITVRGQNLTNDRALEINDSKREEARLKAAAEKAPNSEQGKAMSYAARMQQSHAIMEEMLAGGTKTPSKIKGALDSIPLVGEGLGSVANTFVANKDQQKLEQAQRDFINADLRHESGASISPAEFDNARRQYFPMPGDGPDVMAQKAQNRRIAIEGMKVQAGPGATKIDGILDRSSIDLTKVKPGTPEYKAVMADAANIGALRNKSKPAAKPSLDDIFGK